MFEQFGFTYVTGLKYVMSDYQNMLHRFLKRKNFKATS